MKGSTDLPQGFCRKAVAYSEPRQTNKLGDFLVKMVNGLKPLFIFKAVTILAV